jgi:hypothetical protein
MAGGKRIKKAWSRPIVCDNRVNKRNKINDWTTLPIIVSMKGLIFGLSRGLSFRTGHRTRLY